jgi:phage gpG-like protein
VSIGSNQIYASTHQFGRGAIPARPYLGLSTNDEQSIIELALAHMRRAE